MHWVPRPADGTGRRGGNRPVLLRAPDAGRRRQHHCPGHLPDRPVLKLRRRLVSRRRPVGGKPDRRLDAGHRAVVQDRDHHQGVHQAGVGVRGDDGHRQPRGADAVELHRRHRGPGRERHRGIPALAAPGPARRHHHRLRLRRRHQLDQGRHRHPHRLAGHRPGRAVRDISCPQHGAQPVRYRRVRNLCQSPPRTPAPSITSASAAPGQAERGPATTSGTPLAPTGGTSSARPAPGSPSAAAATSLRSCPARWWAACRSSTPSVSARSPH